MEPIEKQLRDFLQDLIEGEKSPVRFTSSVAVYDYIKENISPFEIEVLNMELAIQKGKVGEEKYIIKSDKQIKPSFRHFAGSFPYISDNDLLRESELTKSYDHISRIQNRKRELFEYVLDYKKLQWYDISQYKDVLYFSTYKIEIIVFSQRFSTLDRDEVMREYYKIYLKSEFKKIKFDLGKYFEPQYWKKFIKTIVFYQNRNTYLKAHRDGDEFLAVHEMINNSLEDLSDYLTSRFKEKKNNAIKSKKLVWNGPIEDFFEFFDELIKNGYVQYLGKEDPISIFLILMKWITVTTKPSMNYKMVYKRLNIPVPHEKPKIKDVKLEWTKSRNFFARRFRPLINFNDPDNSQLLCGTSSDLFSISSALFDIFMIRSSQGPNKGDPISPGSLYTAIKQASF